MQHEPGAFVPQHVQLVVLDLEHVVFDAISLKLSAIRRAILAAADELPHDIRLPDGADIEEAYAVHGSRWFEQLQLGLSTERVAALGSIVQAQARVLAAGGMGSVYPGVPEMLQLCRQIGLSLALGAECNRDFLLAVCDCHGFDSVFDLMACTQDYGSGGVFELLEDLTERFETHTSECVYLGTRAVCLEAATALGVTSLGCRWGLRGASEVGRADRQADRPDEIPDVLQEIDLQLKHGET